jgi:hypothetical protein
MATNVRWQTQQVQCPEQKVQANLLIQWQDTGTESILRGVSCDHPRLRDLDNWECCWSCLEQIESAAG